VDTNALEEDIVASIHDNLRNLGLEALDVSISASEAILVRPMNPSKSY